MDSLNRWDLNPSPYISRFAAAVWNEIGITLPSCKSHYKMLGMTDRMSFFNDIAYDPHSTTHSLMGGNPRGYILNTKLIGGVQMLSRKHHMKRILILIFTARGLL